MHLQIFRWSRSLPHGARNHELPAFCHQRILHFTTWYAQSPSALPVRTLASWNCRVSGKTQWNSYHCWCCTVWWPPPISPSAGDTYPQPVHLLQARRSSPAALASMRGARHACSPRTTELLPPSGAHCWFRPLALQGKWFQPLLGTVPCGILLRTYMLFCAAAGPFCAAVCVKCHTNCCVSWLPLLAAPNTYRFLCLIMFSCWKVNRYYQSHLQWKLTSEV